ncbi:hypothetical protein [Lentzea aerocolonigenes]|uniref:hypothetical protein n=1 Tax=Lentzea aerocolonigenes TaxID=68170 RepID=UPI000751502E|nr:hypothetical protein [Lentzea aerocolonigenes]MCP2248190.1 hypothetical protein [Lentzea aerocolonigenes]
MITNLGGYGSGMATPLEDEQTAAWVLQTAVHDVLAAMINGEVCGPHAFPYFVARGELSAWDRAAILIAAVEPWLRGLHPDLIAALHSGVRCALAGNADEAMIHLFRVWEPLVVMAQAELDLPTRQVG